MKFSLLKRITPAMAMLLMTMLLVFDSSSDDDSKAPLVTISDFSPSEGSEGTTIIITGTNFSNILSENKVEFNGTPAIPSSATPTTLTVTAPAGAGTGKIKVQIGTQTATSINDFEYLTIMVSTFAGGTEGFLDGTGTAARFKFPSGVAFDAFGNLYVADYYNYRIRKITSGGVVSTLAGSGTLGSIDGIGSAAAFNAPASVAVDASGNVYVSDYGSSRIRKITSDGMVSTLAGSANGFADGIGTLAQFDGPRGLAVDAMGNIYVADESNHRVRKITSSGQVSTFAGSSTSGFADGTGSTAQFSYPNGVAVDASGNVYVTDTGNHRIRKITPSGVVTTLAGSSEGFADGIGTAAQFNDPIAVAVDGSGNVYVTEYGNSRIRKITASGVVNTLAGTGTIGFADGVGSAAQFNNARGVSLDASGNVYVADTGNHRIRKISIQ